MTRPLIIGAIGLVVVLLALALNFWILPEEEPSVRETATAPKQEAASPAPQPAPQPTTSPKSEAKAETPTAPAPKQEEAASQAPAKAPQPQQQEQQQKTEHPAPSFDVVRVDPQGNTVLAGRGCANGVVTIRDGAEVLGTVTADSRGEWVFIPSEKLAPGQRALILSQKCPDGQVIEATETVVVVIPEEGKDLAGRDTDKPTTPLAIVVPKEDNQEQAVARVIQAPAAGPLTKQTKEEPTPAPTPTASQPTATPTPKVQETAKAQVASPKPAPTVQPAPTVATPKPEAPAPKPEEQPVAVKSIDYDKDGNVTVQGTAKPKSEVEVAVNNQTVATVKTDEDGNWKAPLGATVKPGTHNLKVTETEPATGKRASLVLPFRRADPLSALPDGKLVVIQPGDNLWKISVNLFGQGTRYIEIYDANRNQINNPNLIYPGQVFGLPKQD